MTALLDDRSDAVLSLDETAPIFFSTHRAGVPRAAAFPGLDAVAALEDRVSVAKVLAGVTEVGSAASRTAVLPVRLVTAVALVAGDALAFLAAWSVLVAFGSTEVLSAVAAVVAAGAAISVFGLEGLYPGYRLHDHGRLRRRVFATLELGAAAGLAAGVLSEEWSKAAFLAAYFGLGLGFQLVFQESVRAMLHRAGLWGENTFLIGSPQDVAQLQTFFRRNWRYGVRPAAEEQSRIAMVAVLPSPEEMVRLRESFAELVLIGSGPGITLAGRGGEIGLTLPRRSGAGQAPLERALDLAVALPAVVFLFPVMGLACLAIRLVDPGPVLYRQMREGLCGRQFPVLKLRTMYLDAEARLEHLLQTDPAARSEWETHFKLRNDPRVLPFVGRLLRASSIDELPQFFNVIAGNMRIVGPRPFPDYHLAAMDAAFRARRCRMKPGLTGLWQISERSAADVLLQQQIDDFYMENRSFWFDLHIILNTVTAVFRRRGAY